MTKFKVAAAAFAAGMMTFAASAKDKVENPKVLAQSAAKKVAEGKTQKATEEAEACPYLFGCGSAKKAAEKVAQPNVDKVQTASVSVRVSPHLIAKARKDAKGIDKPAGKEVKGSKAKVSGLQYGSIVARYAASYGVPAPLAHAVIRIESNYRVNALGSAGEIGLMQIKPSTARMLGYSGSSKGLYNPETNIKFGIKYLAMARKLGGGTTCGTILKYNAGHAAKRMNPVSADYCSKVKRHLAGA
jgi:soluble lytic murein transglycosylase-like protein